MEFKILVTGKNEEVASDLHEHLVTDKGYTVVRCEPTNAAIFDTLLDESPEVVIICLGEETSESIKPFDLLKNGTHKGNCITIVIANEKDEKLFLRYTRLDRAYLLSRPVSLDRSADFERWQSEEVLLPAGCGRKETCRTDYREDKRK